MDWYGGYFSITSRTYKGNFTGTQTNSKMSVSPYNFFTSNKSYVYTLKSRKFTAKLWTYFLLIYDTEQSGNIISKLHGIITKLKEKTHGSLEFFFLQEEKRGARDILDLYPHKQWVPHAHRYNYLKQINHYQIMKL